MQAVDNEVIAAVTDILSSGREGWLATVVATWGSSPRPVGSMLACDRNGHLVGSLSGGCVEDDLLEKLTGGELARSAPQFFRYGKTTEESERLGLPCGGHLDVVIEPLTPRHGTQFSELASTLRHRGCALRRVDVATGTTTLEPASEYVPLRWDAAGRILEHTYGPRHHLFAIGATMVTQYLADMALKLDYTVTVCDPREQPLEDFAIEGITRVREMPDDAIRKFASDAATAIVALTHDPRIDDMGLLQAFQTDAFYIGAMGSSRTSANRRDRLRALGIDDAQLARLHAPIGLPIGSKTPPEIAVSILAEITAVRNNMRTAGAGATVLSDAASAGR